MKLDILIIFWETKTDHTNGYSPIDDRLVIKVRQNLMYFVVKSFRNQGLNHDNYGETEVLEI